MDIKITLNRVHINGIQIYVTAHSLQHIEECSLVPQWTCLWYPIRPQSAGLLAETGPLSAPHEVNILGSHNLKYEIFTLICVDGLHSSLSKDISYFSLILFDDSWNKLTENVKISKGLWIFFYTYKLTRIMYSVCVSRDAIGDQAVGKPVVSSMWLPTSLLQRYQCGAQIKIKKKTNCFHTQHFPKTFLTYRDRFRSHHIFIH